MNRQFFVIDKTTGQEPDMEQIALHEQWANGLIYCDMEGFAVGENGSLYLLDECGAYRCCPEDRFEIVWVNSKDSHSLLAAGILSAAIEDGRDRKRRLRKRLADWAKVRREYGRVPKHTDIILRRAYANHAKAVRKARWLHAVLPANAARHTSECSEAERR